MHVRGGASRVAVRCYAVRTHTGLSHTCFFSTEEHVANWAGAPGSIVCPPSFFFFLRLERPAILPMTRVSFFSCRRRVWSVCSGVLDKFYII